MIKVKINNLMDQLLQLEMMNLFFNKQKIQQILQWEELVIMKKKIKEYLRVMMKKKKEELKKEELKKEELKKEELKKVVEKPIEKSVTQTPEKRPASSTLKSRISDYETTVNNSNGKNYYSSCC